MNQICYRRSAEIIQIFQELTAFTSFSYLKREALAFHKLRLMMKAGQNPAQNISLDIASNGKNALASLRPTNGC